MSVDISGFDASKVDPFVEFQPIPAGDYLGALVESELKEAKQNNANKYINAKFQIIDGPHKGVHVWEIFNLVNANDQAVAIAQAKLSSLCRAVGVLQPRSTADLYNKPVVLKLTVEERSDKKGSYNNKIADFKPAGGQSLTVVQPQAQTQGGSVITQPSNGNGGAAGFGGKKPWEK